MGVFCLAHDNCVRTVQHPAGPNEVSIRDPSVIYPLYGTSGLPKGPRMYYRLSYAPALIDPADSMGW